MTYPGLGGQQPPPQNAAPAAQLVPGVQPGVTGTIIRVNKIIVSGSGEGIFSYSSNPPAAGTLVQTAGLTAGGTDQYGNAYLSGTTSYTLVSTTWIATQVFGDGIIFYSATSAAGPYSQIGAIQVSTLGFLSLQFGGVSGFIPASSAGITTVAQVVSALQSAGIFS